jgi:HlyD family secretion protein
MKSIVRILVVVALAGSAAGFWYWRQAEQHLPQFRIEPVIRGNLVASISATGTIEPQEVVDVGAQVAGKIESLGPDPNDPSRTIDYGSAVDVGTVLAQIDDDLYKTSVDQAKATLQRAEADLGQLRARVYQREREWGRMQKLAAQGRTNVAETTYDAAQADYEAAKAALAVGEAQVAQSRAALEQAEINLRYTTIKSPVKGVIIDRRVNVGQTVVASLNAPSLFLIAKDLRRLEVWAAVNEADIGRIHPGQRVEFTVDAFPGQTFRGEVIQTRLNATMTQNVVTYTVVIDTDNSSGKLIPYLTANVNFEVGRRENVLLVPNAALRWQPKPEQIAPQFRAQYRAAASDNTGSSAGHGEADRQGTIWSPVGSFVRPIQVAIGMTDNSLTEITGGGIVPGTKVVTGELEAGDVDATPASPFTPQFRAPRRT